MNSETPNSKLEDNRMLAELKRLQQKIVSEGLNDALLGSSLDLSSQLGPRRIETSLSSRPTVSLCMIAKNEEAHLARCLQSVYELTDELIVVDTGSSDRTREIAHIFRAHVYEHTWVDDFSEARNVSLAKASGDWIFVLDADEVISESDHFKFRELLKRGDKRPVVYQFDSRNYCNEINVVGWIPKDGQYAKEEAGNGWTSSKKARLFPNHPNIRFHYPIHELVEPSLEGMDLDLELCDIPVHHYGKLVQKTTEAKKETYYQLGKKKLSEFVGNPSALREIAIQSGIVGNHQEATELWTSYVAMCPEDVVGHIFLATSYGQLGQHEKAAASSRRALLLEPHHTEAQYNHGLSQFLLGHGALAQEAFEQVLKLQPDYLPATFMLAASYCCRGMANEGKRTFDGLKTTALAPELSARCLELTRGLLTNQLLDPAIALLETAIASNVVDENVQPLLSNLYRFKNGL